MVKLQQRGMLLVIVMVLLVVLTIIVMSNLQATLSETKMSSNFATTYAVLDAANAKLEQYEQKIVQGGKVSSAEIISTELCNTTIYRITASAAQGTASAAVQSTFAKVGDTAHCDPKPNIVPGRQSWCSN